MRVSAAAPAAVGDERGENFHDQRDERHHDITRQQRDDHCAVHDDRQPGGSVCYVTASISRLK